MVGASATGTQIASEIRRSGRAVTLSVGEHVRAPRVYRGRDIQWWMDASGILDERYDEVDHIVRARNVPSLQLAGQTGRCMLDLNALRACGVKLVGRIAGVNDGRAQFSGSLQNQCALSDLKMNRMLDRINQWASPNGFDDEVGPPSRFSPTEVDASPDLILDLRRGGIKTILWATGFSPDYSWLHVPVFDRKGRVRHDGGVVIDAPGMYLMGVPFLRRRRSSLIGGAGDDARDLSTHLASFSVEYQKEGRGGKVRAALSRHTGNVTIPQIFVGGNFVGGCTDVFDAFKEGRLQTMLVDAGVSFSNDAEFDPYFLLPGWIHPREKVA